jgi:hypothetical protein
MKEFENWHFPGIRQLEKNQFYCMHCRNVGGVPVWKFGRAMSHVGTEKHKKAVREGWTYRNVEALEPEVYRRVFSSSGSCTSFPHRSGEDRPRSA